MARITMRKVQETKLSEVFTLYLVSAAARGVKDKTLRTYEQHFNAISKRLDVDSNISLITSKHLDKMILRMREDGLSDSSINSYTRTLKVFFSWCNEQGYTKTNLQHSALLVCRFCYTGGRCQDFFPAAERFRCQRSGIHVFLCQFPT